MPNKNYDRERPATIWDERDRLRARVKELEAEAERVALAWRQICLTCAIEPDLPAHCERLNAFAKRVLEGGEDESQTSGR